MTVLAADRRRPRPGPLDEPAPTRFDGPSGAPTLDDAGGAPTLDAVVSGAWQSLGARPRVACPLCGGDMVAGYGAHARPVEGRCADCGTVLS